MKGPIVFGAGMLAGIVLLFTLLRTGVVVIDFVRPQAAAPAEQADYRPRQAKPSRREKSRAPSEPVASEPAPSEPEEMKADLPTPSDAGGVLTPPMSDEERLMRRGLALPLPGLKLSDIRDSFAEKRGGTRAHEAIDILAPRGTPVLAVDDGTIQKLFTSVQGGLTVYQFDREEIYCFYYAHLDRYAEGLVEGMKIKRGDRIGYVGTTGNAPPGTPHLHFAIFKIGPEKRWWQGTPVNPYPVLVAAAREQAR